MTSLDVALKGSLFLQQIVAQHDICSACLKIVCQQGVLVENIQAALHLKHQYQPDKTKRITTSLIQKIIAEAKEIERSEFSLLCRNTLVALCGGLESQVKDVAAAIVLGDKLVMKKLETRAATIRADGILAKTESERARAIIEELYRKESAKHGQSRKLMRLLEAVGCGVLVDGVAQREIDEAFEVRNAIVHRGGKIDHQLKAKARNINGEVGNDVDLSGPIFARYRSAIMTLSEEIPATFI